MQAMPLLSKLVDNRANTSGVGKASVRYCDSELSRHHISGPTFCSFASPEITSLVPEEQRHRRLREGGESNHYSFNSIQSASLLLRLNKRFDSIENDRQENIVDVLNDINNRFKESNSLLKKVSDQVESDGTVCTLLKQICDSFRESLISESPQLETVAKNTSFLVDHSSNQVLEIRDFRKDVISMAYGLKDTIWSTMGTVGDKVEKNTSEMCSLKLETQLVSSSLERMEATIQMNGLDQKQELTELRHEVIQLKEELRSIKEAIIEVLPNKLVEALNPISSLGSDISFVSQKSEVSEDNDNEEKANESDGSKEF